MSDRERRSTDRLTPRFDCTDCVDYEAEYGLDFTQLNDLAYRTEFCQTTGREERYQALSFDQECRLLSALGDVHDPDAVCRVLVLHYRWKMSSNPKEYDHPQAHEHLFKQTFDVDCEVRGENPPSHQVKPRYRAVAGALYCVTQTFLERTRGAEVTLYRGLSRHASDLIAQALRTEAEPRYEMPANVFKNFTASEAFTAYYSPLVFRLEMPRTAVAFAADQLAKYREHGNPAERDAEYRVFGDELEDIPSDDVYILADGTRTPLFDFLATKNAFTRLEHCYYIDAIRHLATDDERITDNPGASRIEDWYGTLVDDEYEFAEAIEDVVRYVVGRADDLPSGWQDDVAETFGANRI